MPTVTEKSFCILDYARVFPLFLCSVRLEISTERKHQGSRTFCVCIGNLKIQVACAKRKAVADETSRKKRWIGCSKSTVAGAREFKILQKTAWKRSNFKPYQSLFQALQLLQNLKSGNKNRRLDFSIRMQEALECEDFASKLIFSNEATFHVSRSVNRHNNRVWGNEAPHEILELQRNSPKGNVSCAMSETKLYVSPFFSSQRKL
ncbi:hypothetical protein AVEN_46232-1 [Araneus ventricosus]|uniref:Uncharacterized protein n=1 Tax=Araneus ventricosus TaxID=182803 RepID=A0A4Y2VS25_ARAVE|nr:hypothetical protein AVEN_46232-1 [Araneus ventricosus]